MVAHRSRRQRLNWIIAGSAPWQRDQIEVCRADGDGRQGDRWQ
ncbi:hypothetical protein SynRCC2555_00665 [Synechococcus sp. WH 8101]|nr:hypothetical protein SynRCC2555_00665 [Synechococcus sp. WH 8101]